MRFFVLACMIALGSLARAEFQSPQSIAIEFAKTKETLLAKEERRRRALSSLFQVNRSLHKLVVEKSRQNEKRMSVENATRQLAATLIELEKQGNQQRSMLRSRLSAIYKFSGDGLLRVLFSASSSGSLDRNLRILGAIAKQDITLIKSYTLTGNDLRAKKGRFLERLESLKLLEKDLATRELTLRAETQRKSKLLNELKKEKDLARARLAKLRERDDSGILDSLFQASFFEQKGLLPLPIEGPIVQKFGLIKDARMGITLSHKGVYLRAYQPTPVKAIFHGKVSYVGIVPGLGTTIILDHGDHYYTVYGGVANTDTSVNEIVSQGQAIASAGKSPHYLAQGLYFEVRHFSEPEDPTTWVKGINL